MSIERPPKRLVLATLAFLILLVAGVVGFNRTHLPKGISIDVTGQPTLGYAKAKVHVVVFEEPKCVNCRDFTKEIFPQIKKDFIDTNKILYTVVPVSFLPGSMPAATALLCTYYTDQTYPNSQLFFTYLDYVYDHQPPEQLDWATSDKMLELADQASPAIDGKQVKKCVDMETYRIRIAQNTEYGRKIMGGGISTPTLYVNGIEVKELTYDSISKLIKEVLKHEGVN